MSRLSAVFVLIAAIAASAGAQQPAAPKPAPKVSKEEAALRAQAKVGEDSARKIALKTVPGATVKAAEVEKENGKLIWSMELTVAGKKGIEEVNIDAMTGKVIAKEHESDAKEAKEAKDEAAAKASKANAPAKKP